MDVFPLDQLSHKGAAERGADRAVEPPSEVLFDIGFDLLRDREHIRKDRAAAVKAVVIDADQVILLPQSIQHRAEVRLIIAGRPRQQHQRLSRALSHFVKLHLWSLPVSLPGFFPADPRLPVPERKASRNILRCALRGIPHGRIR